jgi:tetratricopeptide (TPR) repeat protein
LTPFSGVHYIAPELILRVPRRGSCSALLGMTTTLSPNVRKHAVADANDPRDAYRNVPEEDRKAAKKFFEYAHQVAGSGQFDYAIEMFIQGLDKDPEDTTEHQNLREVSLKRKASGGKPLGFLDRGKLRNSKDDKQNMLNAEKLLAFDPGNTDYMVSLLQNAHRAGCYDTVMWIGPVLLKANADAKKPEFNKFIILKDVYKSIREWARAVEACQHAAAMKPDDMDLQTELKNLGAFRTMAEGGYESSRSFRDSVRDRDSQDKLMHREKDVQSLDFMMQQVAEYEQEWRRDPNEAGKLMKYIDALLKTERPEQENKAIEVLEQSYEKTRQFRFRQKIGMIKLAQIARMVRSKSDELTKDPANAEIKKELAELQRFRAEEELKEFSLWAEHYPTDSKIKFDVATRTFLLGRFADAIPAFQTVRSDPKYRIDATTLLGRSFLEAGFVDEAAETLRAVIEDYINKGDAKSKEMYYWYARAMEQLGDRETAKKAYSQVAQWEFKYRDVQDRIRNLRSGGAPGGGAGNGGSSTSPAPV